MSAKTAFPAHSGKAVTAPVSKHGMPDYTAEMFLPYVQRRFSFDAAGSAAKALELELLEVKRPASGARPRGFREPFSLLFALRAGEPSAQGLHRLMHEDFEPCEWFLSRVFVPTGEPGVSFVEAVFG